jgi:hypothetical protein
LAVFVLAEAGYGQLTCAPILSQTLTSNILVVFFRAALAMGALVVFALGSLGPLAGVLPFDFLLGVFFFFLPSSEASSSSPSSNAS